MLNRCLFSRAACRRRRSATFGQRSQTPHRRRMNNEAARPGIRSVSDLFLFAIRLTPQRDSACGLAPLCPFRLLHESKRMSSCAST